MFKNVIMQLKVFFLEVFVFPKIRKQVFQILADLQEPVTQDNFFIGFRKKLSRLGTTDTIEKAVRRGIIQWNDIGCKSVEDLDEIYLEHLAQVVVNYSASFSSGYWKSSKHVSEGREAFVDIACWNRLPSESALPIKMAFCRELYISSHRDGNIPVTEAQIREYLMEVFQKTADELGRIQIPTRTLRRAYNLSE